MTNPHPSPPAAPTAEGPDDATGFALYGSRFQREPAEVYRRIRQEHGQVAPVVLEGDAPAWLVLGYREVWQVTSNPQLFGRDSRRWHSWDRVAADWSLRPYAEHQPCSFHVEGEEHQRRAGATGDALAAVDQFQLRSEVERIADGLIDEFAGRGEADLIAQYALRLPVLVIAGLLGLPESDAPALARDIAASADEGEEAVRAHQRVVARMQRLVAEKREGPGDDVPSRLLAHPAGLPHDEIPTDLFLIMGAGQLTTADWLGNTLRLMLTDDRFALNLSGGRRSIGQALNEVLWEDTPTQNFVGRWATRDTELGGRRIRKGDMVVLGLAAANTDPQVRPQTDPEALGNQAHMSFSHGEHGCPQAAREVAEVIAETGVEVLLDRLPDVTLAVAADDLVWRPSVWMRGLIALPVRFTPAPVRGHAG
ncbi:cytochrome P450 [Actinoallomurus purpureus]|nr:cytochrome P450 [Actinoallomurus purpureus]MCO6006835.1 cytochrome P450 [Actinoallomurus purpureus]